MNKLASFSVAAVLLVSNAAFATEFPATVQYRKAATGPGYVLMIETTIKQDFPAILTVTSKQLGTTNKYNINLSSKHKNQYGYLEGITFYPGDEFVLENTNYETLHGSIPR